MQESQLQDIVNFTDPSPLETLGLHPFNGGYVIRAYLPIAKNAWIKIGSEKQPMNSLGNGIFTFETSKNHREYKILYEDSSKFVHEIHDPYNFGTSLTEYDIFLYKEGRLFKGYTTFGAHLITENGVPGVRFIVWAPSGIAVSVIGNFNHWTVGMNPMTNVKSSGIWELFVPNIGENEYYKYAIKTSSGKVNVRTDPYAFFTEPRPRTASIVVNLHFVWTDSEWIEGKPMNSLHRPMSIYEIHLGSWHRKNGGFMNYRDIADLLVVYLEEAGFNFVEFLPVMEHPLDISWGYQTLNYFAPTARYGTPDDFMYLVNKLHENGIGIILDWVPAHFPDDEFGLSMYDGTHLYDYSDPRKGRTPDWGTNVFDFGKNEVRNFLISSALFWFDFYHVDGIRVDAVTSMLYLDFSRKEWIPNKYGGNINLEAVSFLQELNKQLHTYFPSNVTIAEESSSYGSVTSPVEFGGLGFDYKWNMGWMHDTLDFFATDPLFRKDRINALTFSISYAFSEKYILPISHDEVVYGKKSLFGKMPGNNLSNVRLFLSYMFSYPGKKLLFMGNEFAQSVEWNVLSELKWREFKERERQDLYRMVGELNRLYVEYSAFHYDDSHDGFEWVDFNDKENTVISFLRKSPEDEILCIFNMTPVMRENYCIGVNRDSYYGELFNSDLMRYGGTGIHNGEVHSSSRPFHNRKFSIEITLPPLAGLFFRCKNDK
ncbi:MAG: 1,4-alpha-glucan branching protein GlgB [Thermoplasmatales archaeon]|nr:1,4-alpha-glucan branching protein GlgB [Thermoplasmatales archaeon]MCW6169854.1 1,4-alpha-glucan branching protein GlgB [Thermoplasmatales archaeon]